MADTFELPVLECDAVTRLLNRRLSRDKWGSPQATCTKYKNPDRVPIKTDLDSGCPCQLVSMSRCLNYVWQLNLTKEVRLFALGWTRAFLSPKGLQSRSRQWLLCSKSLFAWSCLISFVLVSRDMSSSRQQSWVGDWTSGSPTQFSDRSDRFMRWKQCGTRVAVLRDLPPFPGLMPAMHVSGTETGGTV